MKRFLAALMAAALLAAVIPGVASASRVTRVVEDRLGVDCGADIDGTFISGFIERNVAFGDFAGIEVWPPDAEVPSLSGFTDTIGIVEGAEIVLSATIPLVDAAGDPAGDGELVVTVTPLGDSFVDEGDDSGNLNSHTRLVVQPLEGTAAITLPGEDPVEAACFGEQVRGVIFQTNPTAFTFHRDGVAFDCSWQVDDTFFFVQGELDSRFGSFIDAAFFTETSGAGVDEPFAGTFDASGVDADLHLAGFDTGDEYTASVQASFTPDGDPVRYVLVQQGSRQRVVRQPLSVDGTFEVSTGAVLTMDDESCNANVFSERATFTAPAGPRKGKRPANDAPAGAIALVPGSTLNVQTTGAAPDAEVPNFTCDDGETDLMGHTVWYTLVGTGGPLRFDTTGSNFDTVVAAYVMEGDELVEIACADDVFDEGISLQAVLEGDTVEGLTYWIQVGGWGGIFGVPQSGRLRVEVSEVEAAAASAVTRRHRARHG